MRNLALFARDYAIACILAFILLSCVGSFAFLEIWTPMHDPPDEIASRVAVAWLGLFGITNRAIKLISA